MEMRVVRYNILYGDMFFEKMLMSCSVLTDNTTISNSYILDSAICWIYKGNDGGSEPKKLASAPDGKACVINPVKASVC